MRILITGTPGTGKSTLAHLFMRRHPAFFYVNVSDFVLNRNLVLRHDEEFDSAIPDEEALLDALEEVVADYEAFVIDHHSSDSFPIRWFDAVVLLHATTENIYDRLRGRGYSDSKIRENIEAEVLGVTLEAVADFPAETVLELDSNTRQDLDAALVALERFLGIPEPLPRPPPRRPALPKLYPSIAKFPLSELACARDKASVRARVRARAYRRAKLIAKAQARL